MQTPLEAWQHQVEMSNVISEVNPCDLTPKSRAQWLLIQMQGLRFLSAYCLAQTGVIVVWDE